MLDDLHALHPLVAVVYCLSETETARAFANRCWNWSTSTETVGTHAEKERLSRADAVFFRRQELVPLYDDERRLQRWLEPTAGTFRCAAAVGPCMPTAVDKGALQALLVV